MELFGYNKIYFIGIKGAGMTALAQIFKYWGKEVWGSDVADKFFTDEVLTKSNIKVIEKFDAGNITDDIDLVIYSTAYNEANPEVAAAKNLGLKILSYPEALGLLFYDKYGISICGTHGKTTTTAMLGFVLQELGEDPTVVVGTEVPQLGGNARAGKSQYVVVESDEYQNKLKYYNPRAVILTSADYDHPDYFKNHEEYKQVFKDFVARIPEDGVLIAFDGDESVAEIVKAAKCKVIWYGQKSQAPMPNDQNKSVGVVGVGALIEWPDGKFAFQRRDNNTKRYPGMIAPFGGKKDSPSESEIDCLRRELREELELDLGEREVKIVGDIESHFEPGKFIRIFYFKISEQDKLILHEGQKIETISLELALANDKVTNYTKEIIKCFQKQCLDLKLQIPGEHNIWNAMAVLTLIKELGLDVEKAKMALEKFEGSKRRFELIGEVDGIKIYDDYAHHPTEIQKLLKGVRERFPKNKIWCVFQPHTFTRTEALFHEFARSFTDADEVIIMSIFASAREELKPEFEGMGERLVAEIKKYSPRARYIDTIEEAVDYLAAKVWSGDVVFVVGAGENWKVGAELVKLLNC